MIVNPMVGSICFSGGTKKHLTSGKVLLDDYRRRWVKWVYSGVLSSIIG
jgi:hypothetical protein